MAGRTANQTAQHIAAALIGGHNAVGDHKGSGTDMVRNKADGYVLIVILLILRMGKLADLVPKGANRIHIKDGVHVLDYGSQTL